MFDIGAMELFIVAVLALVVVGPKELPALLRTIGGFVRKVRGMANEFRRGIDELADEIAAEADPFSDLKKEEGLRPGMSPEEITETIMGNREREAEEASTDKSAEEGAKETGDTKGTGDKKNRAEQEEGKKS